MRIATCYLIGGVLFGSISCSQPLGTVAGTPHLVFLLLACLCTYMQSLVSLQSNLSVYRVPFQWHQHPLTQTRPMNRSCTNSISTRSLRPGSPVERSYDTMLRVARRYYYDTLSRLGSEPRYISCHRSRLCVLPRHYRLGPSNGPRGVFKYTLDRYLLLLRGRRFVS